MNPKETDNTLPRVDRRRIKEWTFDVCGRATVILAKSRNDARKVARMMANSNGGTERDSIEPRGLGADAAALSPAGWRTPRSVRLPHEVRRRRSTRSTGAVPREARDAGRPSPPSLLCRYRRMRFSKSCR